MGKGAVDPGRNRWLTRWKNEGNKNRKIGRNEERLKSPRTEIMPCSWTTYGTNYQVAWYKSIF
jgi:hypothetical protein